MLTFPSDRVSTPFSKVGFNSIIVVILPSSSYNGSSLTLSFSGSPSVFKVADLSVGYFVGMSLPIQAKPAVPVWVSPPILSTVSLCVLTFIVGVSSILGGLACGGLYNFVFICSAGNGFKVL